MDLEQGTMNSVYVRPFGQLVRPDNSVFGHLDAGNNCVKGHFRDNVELNDSVPDFFREEVGSCACMQHFQLAHSMEGGTGITDIVINLYNVTMTGKAQTYVHEILNAIEHY